MGGKGNKVREILPGVFHWTTFHEGIGVRVHSYFVEAISPAFLIDPRVPSEGLAWFKSHKPPQNIFLTNRLHYRHSGQFARYFSATIWAHRAGRHAFGSRRHPVRLFQHGARLPAGVQALKVGALCPEETALLIPVQGGILAIGDALIREGDRLAFVPDFLMGEDPEGVKGGLRPALKGLLRFKFRHILFAHGQPLLNGAKPALRRFLKS